jgi:hypothetical protein
MKSVNDILDGLMKGLSDDKVEDVKDKAAQFQKAETIKEACERFISLAVPEPFRGNPNVEMEYRKSFYAGAASMVEMMTTVKSEEDMRALLEETHTTLEQFSLEMVLTSTDTRGEA